MGKIIAVVNNKGGVGKTTITVNLGHALTNRGSDVLIVDMDNQCNATSNFFQQVPDETLYELLDGDGLDPAKCIYPTPYDRLFFLPNTEDSGGLEPLFMAREDRGYSLLQQRLRDYVNQKYDFTIIDCPPNLGLFTLQAMTAADFVICPVTGGSKYAAVGLDRTINTIKYVQESLNPSLRFLRLVLNQIDRREGVDRAFITSAMLNYPGLVFETMIPRCTAVKQAEALGQTVIRAAPKATATIKFRKLALELLDMFQE
uniref:ATPase involved in chromosome partitioning n=1 Tax=Desulfovibrio sp. U5L TaxID=596152 RepID=I2Q7Q8_9BACT